MTKLTYNDLKLPNFINTRNVFANLTATDCGIAAVLAQLNLMLAGDTGTGKSQLARDIYNSFFGGNFKDNGQGIFIRAHPETDVYSEVFTQLNLEKGEKELTKNAKALIYIVDEINRAPPVAQNQFFGMGDGTMDHAGQAFKLGQEGYHLLIATANIGNGEFSGTFETDRALLNRLHITLDFDSEILRKTNEDKYKISRQAANPSVKESPKKDLSDLIIAASRQITAETMNPGYQTDAVMAYLTLSLDHCDKNKGSKGKVWPINCQDCSHSKTKIPLCGRIKAPAGERTRQAVLKYTVAMNYLINLKDPNCKFDVADLVFKSFELAGAYQGILNPAVLKTEYQDQNSAMIAEVVKELRKDYEENRRYMEITIAQATRGSCVTDFFKDPSTGRLGNYNTLSDQAKKAKDNRGNMVNPQISPYPAQRLLSLNWVPEWAQLMANDNKH